VHELAQHCAAESEHFLILLNGDELIIVATFGKKSCLRGDEVGELLCVKGRAVKSGDVGCEKVDALVGGWHKSVEQADEVVEDAVVDTICYLEKFRFPWFFWLRNA